MSGSAGGTSETGFIPDIQVTEHTDHELTEYNDYTYNMSLEEDKDAHLEAETENVFLIAFGERQRVEHVPQHGVIVLHITQEISIMNQYEV